MKMWWYRKITLFYFYIVKVCQAFRVFVNYNQVRKFQTPICKKAYSKFVLPFYMINISIANFLDQYRYLLFIWHCKWSSKNLLTTVYNIYFQYFLLYSITHLLGMRQWPMGSPDDRGNAAVSGVFPSGCPPSAKSVTTQPGNICHCSWRWPPSAWCELRSTTR